MHFRQITLSDVRISRRDARLRKGGDWGMEQALEESVLLISQTGAEFKEVFGNKHRGLGLGTA